MPDYSDEERDFVDKNLAQFGFEKLLSAVQLLKRLTLNTIENYTVLSKLNHSSLTFLILDYFVDRQDTELPTFATLLKRNLVTDDTIKDLENKGALSRDTQDQLIEKFGRIITDKVTDETILAISAKLLTAFEEAEIAAEESKRPSCIKSIKEAKAKGDVNYKNDLGETALHFAAEHGDLKFLNALIKAGANLNSTEKNGYSPLTFANAEKKTECVRALIVAGAKNLTKEECRQLGATTPLEKIMPDYSDEERAFVDKNLAQFGFEKLLSAVQLLKRVTLNAIENYTILSKLNHSSLTFLILDYFVDRKDTTLTLFATLLERNLLTDDTIKELEDKGALSRNLQDELIKEFKRKMAIKGLNDETIVAIFSKKIYFLQEILYLCKLTLGLELTKKASDEINSWLWQRLSIFLKYLADNTAISATKWSSKLHSLPLVMLAAMLDVLFDLAEEKLVDEKILKRTFKDFTFKVDDIKEAEIKKISRKELFEPPRKRSELIINSKIRFFISEKKHDLEPKGHNGKVKKLFDTEESTTPKAALKIYDKSIELPEAETEAGYTTFVCEKYYKKYNKVYFFKRFKKNHIKNPDRFKSNIYSIFYLAMPYYTGNTVDHYDSDWFEKVDYNILLQWLLQGFSALYFLHAHYLAHNDISFRNFILSPLMNKLQLIDFGNTRSAWNSGIVKSVALFLPPNEKTDSLHFFQRDVYAIGIVSARFFPKLYKLTEVCGRYEITKVKTEALTVKEKSIFKLVDALLEKNEKNRCRINDAMNYTKSILKATELDEKLLHDIAAKTIDHTTLTPDDVIYRCFRAKSRP